MDPHRLRLIPIFGVLLLVFLVARLAKTSVAGQTSADVPTAKPDAIVDLASEAGVSWVKGQWRYSDTKIIEVDFRGPGADKQPTGAPVRTYDYTPHAGGADFDDSKWELISPTTLDQRRG